MEGNGIGVQQEAATRSNSAPKGKIGAPNPRVLQLNYMQARPYQRYAYPEKADVPETSGTVRKLRRASHFNNIHLPEDILPEEPVPGAKRPRDQEESEAEVVKARRLEE